ncbi:hypothetical protein LR48_Vigan499s000600 [Vigna angularis]|uniref:Uncharacterized protein n=1 Tax=Phaseolus angularis TaxID=3914 RepID=A0A0L9TC21_PHAAN|nr:hypothetical protein LR48_Vigan499s000600 [Vigna angularis]
MYSDAKERCHSRCSSEFRFWSEIHHRNRITSTGNDVEFWRYGQYQRGLDRSVLFVFLLGRSRSSMLQCSAGVSIAFGAEALPLG